MVYVHVTADRLEEHILTVGEPRATIDEDLQWYTQRVLRQTSGQFQRVSEVG